MSDTMKALAFVGPGKVGLVEREIPTPAPARRSSRRPRR